MTDTNTQKGKELTLTPSEEDFHQRLVALGWWKSVPHATLSVRWLRKGEQRLDASYYGSHVVQAVRLVVESGYEIANLGDLASHLGYPGRFKRVYADTEDSGIPFLTVSQMLHFRPISDRFLAYSCASLTSCLVQPGWLLVTRSGTVGRCVIVGKRLSRFAISDDAIRIETKDIPTGYLYAFLSSWIGQALLSKDQYGSAIKHLEPAHLARLAVPILPEAERDAIHTRIARAYSLRDEVNDLFDEADKMLHSELGLQQFDAIAVDYLSAPDQERAKPHMPHSHAFVVTACELNGRLDASHHVPIIRAALHQLHRSKYRACALGALVENVVIPPRFKRIYVSKNDGVPFLRPSHLPQMRPHDLGHISRLTRVLGSLLLRKGDVLVTTDGTVGRISLVSSRREGWAGSNNIGRITYGPQDGRNGYLAAFLMTPYGQHQLRRETYGGVVDHIEVPHIEHVLVPDAPHEVQTAIGERVVRAFEKKDEATRIEETAIGRLETLLAAPHA